MARRNAILWRKLKKTDRTVYKLYKREIKHQNRMLSLNANDNLVSIAVLETASSLFVNSYPENYRQTRNLRRTANHDKVEKITRRRALRLFNLDRKTWNANVRPISGTSANFVVFMALAGINGKIMGIKQEMGGHHSFTFAADKGQDTFKERIFTPSSYTIGNDGVMDYESLEKEARAQKPQIIIAGGYAISSDIDYAKVQRIARSVNAILLCDIAHPSGLISHDLMNSPFEYCDVVTTVMQKTMGGPRAGIIYCRKRFRKKIDDAQTVLCGNAHTHVMLQVAVALKEAASSGHRRLMRAIQKNASYLSEQLRHRGFKTFATENHMVLIDLHCVFLAHNFELLADFLDISLDRVSLVTHPSISRPTGIRIGTTGITRRGMGRREIEQIADILLWIREYVIKMMDVGPASCGIGNVYFTGKRLLIQKEFENNAEIYKMKAKIRQIAVKCPVPHIK